MTANLTPEERRRRLERLRISWWTAKIITILGLLYLIYSFNLPQEKRLGQTELVLIAVMFLFNSGLIEKVESIAISSDGVQAEFAQRIKEEVEEKVEEVEEQLESKQKEVQKTQQVQQKELDALRFVLCSYLSEWEFNHLKKLVAGESFPYRKRQRFTEELKRLRSLKLIEHQQPDQRIGSMKDQGDLREYFKITPQGIEYLQLRQAMEEEQVPIQAEGKELTSSV